MEVLSFQIGIFATIFLIGALGRKARIYICVAIGIFTLFAVFTTWLAILQFFTIFIAYSFSENFADPNSEEGAYNFGGCLKTVFTIVLLVVIISFLMNTCNSNNKSDSKEEIKNDSINQTVNESDVIEISPGNFLIKDSVENVEPEIYIDTLEKDYRYNDEDENVYGQE